MSRIMPALLLLALGLVILATAVSVYAIFSDSDSVTPNDFASDTLDSATSLGATGGASVDLSWTATADTYADGHRVLRSTTSGGPYSQIAEVTPRTTTTYTDSPADGTYYYVLRSFYQNWESANGNEASATVGACTAGTTGFLSPTAQAADTGGNGDGFELNPTNAFLDDAAFASNNDNGGDRHRFYNYAFSIPGTCAVRGIEVRLDWWLESISGANSIDVELSWDGGTTWTAAKNDDVETTTEHSSTLGSSVDRWGHTWSVAEFSDANFRARLTSNSASSTRDFFLDWVPVNVHYGDAIQNTGFLSPSAQAAVTTNSGDNDGFELNPTDAFADGGGFAEDVNSGTTTAVACGDTSKDRHLYYNYGFSIPASSAIHGIEVRLDAWADSILKNPFMCVDLSWDGGTSWTATKTTPVLGTAEVTFILGGEADDWGRTWSDTEFGNANFRLRITNVANSTGRDFSLDWVPVKVYYTPPAAGGGAVTILDAWTTGTTYAVSAGTDRLLLVGVYGEDSGAIASINTVTWGGQTLTEIGEATVGTGYSNLVWMGYLNDSGIAAASGSTIVATWSGTTPNESVLYAAVTLDTVDQTTPIGNSSTGTATSVSTVQVASALTVSADDMAVYVTVSGEQGRTHTADTGYTEGTEEDSGGVGQVASNATKGITAGGTEQPTATWSGGANNRLGIVGAVINVAP